MTGSNFMAPMAERTWDQADGEAFRTWLLGPAASLWLERGVDRTAGGYFDQLTFDSAKNSSDFKRLRVCARQIFVFSQLAEAGVTGAREAVLHGLDFCSDVCAIQMAASFARRRSLAHRSIPPAIFMITLSSSSLWQRLID
jgi:hypothetical protein